MESAVLQGAGGVLGLLVFHLDLGEAAEIVGHHHAEEFRFLHVHGHHLAHDGEGVAVVFQAAEQRNGFQKVVGDLGIVFAERGFAPLDGHLQVVIGVFEFAGGGAHRGQLFQHIVARRVVGRRRLRQVPGIQEVLARPVVIALEILGVAGAHQRRDIGRRRRDRRGCLGHRVLGRRQAAVNREQQHASRYHATSCSTNLLVMSRGAEGVGDGSSWRRPGGSLGFDVAPCARKRARACRGLWKAAGRRLGGLLACCLRSKGPACRGSIRGRKSLIFCDLTGTFLVSRDSFVINGLRVTSSKAVKKIKARQASQGFALGIPGRA